MSDAVITTDSTRLLENACCRKCGYLLHGLPQNVCPECGRAFDPENPKSFTTIRRWRGRHRWVYRAAALLAVAAIGYAFAPRGVYHGTLSFMCKKCGEIEVVRRVELRPPRWISIRYPGVSWSGQERDPNAKPVEGGATCEHVSRTMKFELENRILASSWGSASVSAGRLATLNGLRVEPASAKAVLESFMAPTVGAVGIGHVNEDGEASGFFWGSAYNVQRP